MIMPVNYDELSGRYDRHRRGGGPFLPTLVRLVQRCPGDTVLEIGAGTGNNSQAFLAAFPSRLVGLEPSAGMLAQARKKDLQARWVQADALAVPLRTQSVHFVFGVCVLHHIQDLRTMFAECRRVLSPRGIAAFVTTTHDFIERHPMNRYFPSFSAVDKARFQDVPEVVAALRGAGFEQLGVQRDVAHPHPIDVTYYDRVAARFISTYDLLPVDEFETGLTALRADLAWTGTLDVPIAWECATVWGRVQA